MSRSPVPIRRVIDVHAEGQPTDAAPVSADAALRLARYFGGDAQSWLNLQISYDLRRAEIEMATTIKREVLPRMD